MKAPHDESRPKFGRRRSSALPVVMMACLCMVLSGCESYLKDYTRSYYVAGVDRFGQRVEIGATFTPPQARTMMETLEREGVVAPGAKLVEVKPEVLEVAGRQLEILQGAEAPRLELPATGTKASAAPWTGVASSSVAMVWLTNPRDGKLRVETSPEVIAMYRNAGWVDAPPPGFETGEAPQWDAVRGKWRVRKMPEQPRLLEKPSTLGGARHD